MAEKDTTKAASAAPSESAAAVKSETVMIEWQPKNTGRKLTITDDSTGREWAYQGRDALPRVAMPRTEWEEHRDRLNKDYQKRHDGLFAGPFVEVEG